MRERVVLLKHDRLHIIAMVLLAGLSAYIANSDTNAATLRLVNMNGRRLWIVGLFFAADSQDSRTRTQKRHVDESPLLVYDLDGNLLIAAVYGRDITRPGLEEFEQTGGPLIGYIDETWNYCMFIFMRNKSNQSAVIMQFELDFRNI